MMNLLEMIDSGRDTIITAHVLRLGCKPARNEKGIRVTQVKVTTSLDLDLDLFGGLLFCLPHLPDTAGQATK